MIEATEKSPGYYAAEVFDYVSGQDPTFKERYTPESLFEKLQDEQYAADLFLWMQKQPERFGDDVLFEEFKQKVKKKDEAVVTESVSDDGSLERLASRDVARDDSQSVLPEYYTGEQTAQRMDLMEQADAQQQSASQEELEAFRLAQQQVRTPPLNEVIGGETRPTLVNDLRDAYGRYGFRFDGAVVGESVENRDGTRTATDGTITVYSQAMGVPKAHQIKLIDGQVSAEQMAAFEEFVAENKTPTMRMEGDTRTFTEKALRVRDIRPVARRNANGSTSTVMMEDAEVDGKFIAYPTLFPRDPDGFYTQPAMWTEMDSDAAIEEAYRRGEVFEFDTAEEAKAFAEGSWKDTNTIDLVGEAYYAERGYDYYAEQAAGRALAEANDEYSFLEELTAGERYEGEIPPEYQRYFIDGNMVRDDIGVLREESEAKANALYEQFDTDEAIKLREDWDVVLGKRQAALSAAAADMNRAAIERQDGLEAYSLATFGTTIEGLIDYEPKTAQEQRDIIAIIGRSSTTTLRGLRSLD
jgi:hypothetical protein